MPAIGLVVSNLETDISVGGGLSIPVRQVQAVTLTCIIEDGTIVRVYADDGVEFSTDGGGIKLSYGSCYEVTHLCDRRALEKQMRAEQREREEMEIHTRGV